MQSTLGRFGVVHVGVFSSRNRGSLLRCHVRTWLPFELSLNEFSTWFRTSASPQPSINHDQDQRNLLSALDKPFAGIVSIQKRALALKAARQETNLPNARRLVLWTDASLPPAESRHEASSEVAGISIVWRSSTPRLFSSSRWLSKTYKLLGSFTSTEAEFFAVSEALKIAQSHLKHKDNQSTPPARKGWSLAGLLSSLIAMLPPQTQPLHCHGIEEIHIYTDSISALKGIASSHKRTLVERLNSPYQGELASLKYLARQLRIQGISLTLSWVPGHEQVEGNELAHTLAARARKSRSLLNPPETLSPTSRRLL